MVACIQGVMLFSAGIVKPRQPVEQADMCMQATESIEGLAGNSPAFAVLSLCVGAACER